MSQVLKEMPTWAEDVDSLGRPAKYPWRDWLDGETHLLVRTTDEYEGDYQTESRFFRHTVIRAAEKRNIEVFVAVHSGRHYEDKRDRMIIKAEHNFELVPTTSGPFDHIDRVLAESGL